MKTVVLLLAAAFIVTAQTADAQPANAPEKTVDSAHSFIGSAIQYGQQTIKEDYSDHTITGYRGIDCESTFSVTSSTFGGYSRKKVTLTGDVAHVDWRHVSSIEHAGGQFHWIFIHDGVMTDFNGKGFVVDSGLQIDLGSDEMMNRVFAAMEFIRTHCAAPSPF